MLASVAREYEQLHDRTELIACLAPDTGGAEYASQLFGIKHAVAGSMVYGSL